MIPSFFWFQAALNPVVFCNPQSLPANVLSFVATKVSDWKILLVMPPLQDVFRFYIQNTNPCHGLATIVSYAGELLLKNWVEMVRTGSQQHLAGQICEASTLIQPRTPVRWQKFKTGSWDSRMVTGTNTWIRTAAQVERNLPHLPSTNNLSTPAATNTYTQREIRRLKPHWQKHVSIPVLKSNPLLSNNRLFIRRCCVFAKFRTWRFYLCRNCLVESLYQVNHQTFAIIW